MTVLTKSGDELQQENSSRYQLFIFYIPLALTALMMNFTSTVVNSAISYMDNSILHLAAFAAAFAAATLTHSPVFTVQQIAIAKADSKKHARMILWIFLTISSGLFLINVLMGFTDFGTYLFEHFIGASSKVTAIAKNTIIAFLPLPLAIVLRGVLQGIIIRNGKTGIISIATLTRLIFLTAFLFSIPLSGYTITAPLAGLGLTIAVIVETIILIPQSYKYYLSLPEKSEDTYIPSTMLRFSRPLIYSMTMWTSSGFFIAAIVGNSVQKDAALAVTGIVYASIGWFLASPAKPIMQMVMIYSELKDKAIKVRNFSYQLVAVLTLIVLFIQIPFIGDFVFSKIFVLPDDLKNIAINAIWFIMFYPALIAHRGYLQGNLIRMEKTFPISFAATARIIVLASAAIISLNQVYDNGAIIGIGILMGSIFIENMLLKAAIYFARKDPLVVFY